MNICDLVVTSTDFDVTAFLGRNKGLRPARVWHKGESFGRAKRPGRTTTSGFVLTLAEGRDADRVAKRSVQMIRKLQPALEDARAHGGDVVVDFGMVVGAPKRFTGSVRFSPPDLQELCRVGIKLQVSAYPFEIPGSR